ncbi:hypothetical protein AQS8620_00851 [Aquimixticola soesokkakensis]|uniref:Uncharacterized protein n=1 Tax=Aquimixticola soesokkakensis TaxID=1519096 RepID=A0A1Y5S1P8_9RHOB|nr:hypothetical protein [Aquimixticola soesokkakensis]SLN27679.1 hypothetical protein AQS8620_00851 [Aquimixticola soesokkakensis]
MTKPMIGAEADGATCDLRNATLFNFAALCRVAESTKITPQTGVEERK